VLTETKVTKDTPVKKVGGTDPAEAIDDEIAKISQEKGSASSARGETSNDGNHEETAEV
jgi:hypothetical protein